MVDKKMVQYHPAAGYLPGFLSRLSLLFDIHCRYKSIVFSSNSDVVPVGSICSFDGVADIHQIIFFQKWPLLDGRVLFSCPGTYIKLCSCNFSHIFRCLIQLHCSLCGGLFFCSVINPYISGRWQRNHTGETETRHWRWLAALQQRQSFRNFRKCGYECIL